MIQKNKINHKKISYKASQNNQRIDAFDDDKNNMEKVDKNA